MPKPEPEEPPEQVDWIDAAVQEAIGWEEQPGTMLDEAYVQRRLPELRTFFQAHPEYEDPERRETLADLACAFQLEGAHERLANPEPTAPLEVEVTGEDWRVLVSHASGWCTSDDWAWFSNSVHEAAEAEGITTGSAGAQNPELVVVRDGTVLVRHPLEDQGYALLQAGKAPEEVEHDMVDGVLAAASAYFGVELER